MKNVIILAGLILCLAQPGPAQNAANQDSLALEKTFDQFFRDYIALRPEIGSYLGLSRQMGYAFDRSRLDDISPDGDRAYLNLLKGYIKKLGQAYKGRITAQQKIDVENLKWQLTVEVRLYENIDNRYVVNHLNGVQNATINTLKDYHPINELRDAEDYLARMERIPAKIDQAMSNLTRQEKKGISAPAFIAERVIAGIDEFTGPAPNQNLLYNDFRDKISTVKSIDPATAADLCRKAEQLIGDSIYPAYRKFRTRVEESRQKADNRAGVWKLPKGSTYYNHCLTYETSVKLSPEQVHQLGLNEVKVLQQRCLVLLDSLGIRGDKSFGKLMEEYWDFLGKPEIKEKISYPQDSSSRAVVLKDYQALIDNAFLLLPQAFSYIPKTKVMALPVPPHKEKGGLTTYSPAPLDGTRKASFDVNLSWLPDKPDMAPLTFHETVPGHHYQIALQQELCQNRMYRNIFWISGFGEGWAMYAQDLACELGWLPDIHSRIAEINSQLFRAVRIVLDTGIHLKKWDKQQALTYMKENLGWASKNEVDRYVVWPGQACSYTLGKIKIKELRERTRAKLGNEFDLKEFHRIVLENGSLPLDVLEKKVDAYIKASI